MQDLTCIIPNLIHLCFLFKFLVLSFFLFNDLRTLRIFCVPCGLNYSGLCPDHSYVHIGLCISSLASPIVKMLSPGSGTQPIIRPFM